MAEVEGMERSHKWLLTYFAIGLTVVVVDIVAIECGKRTRRPIPAPANASTAPGADLR